MSLPTSAISRWDFRLMRFYAALTCTLLTPRETKVVSRWSTQKAGALLAYLAFYRGRRHGREALAEAYGPRASAGRVSTTSASRDTPPQDLTPPRAPLPGRCYFAVQGWLLVHAETTSSFAPRRWA